MILYPAWPEHSIPEMSESKKRKEILDYSAEL
jgi:hypothetical protein